mmetsp:Transcript_15937/g.26858  ORF Transcript_15937/g.26858 Transcript_15937/m.26858 type:complete len:171 (-) Transcript_15937:939-1451(-)
MPYSQQFREKLRIWQSLIVFLELLDPQVYSEQFRAQRQAFSGFDVIQIINTELWKAIKANHVPTIRQYIEIFTVKFCLRYPAQTVGTDVFVEKLLDPNVKPQVSASYVLIAGYCMLQVRGADDSATTQFKMKIFEQLMGFCASNSAHTRCIAQYFVSEIFKDPLFRPFIG